MNYSWEYSESNLKSSNMNMSPAMIHDNIDQYQSFAPMKSKSKTPCRFYMSGKCSFGSRCQFSHVTDTKPESKRSSSDICSFYRAGHCKFGSSCSMKHVDYETEDISKLSQAINEMDFSASFRDSLPSRTLEGGRNSLLPSFLVDELFLDESDHHIQQCQHSADEEEESSSITFERPSSMTPVSMSISVPTSYGEAISSGLSNFPPKPEAFISQRQFEKEPFLPKSDKSDDLCAFSIMGKCRYGSFCRSVHGLQCPRCLLYVLHPTDMERNEEHLDECFSKPESVPISELHQIICGLCHIPILQGVDPRFGLLNCDHAFCLGCIRTWRSTHFDANNEFPRSCPDCKEVSYFIVPSSTWIADPTEKFKVIEQYKKRMSAIPCKYYDYGRGDCPFGSSCFYEHRTDFNDKLYQRPALILDHREQIAKVRDTKLSDYIVFKTAPARNKNKK
jgi:E3 ubiquitin-protein ligase makorin